MTSALETELAATEFVVLPIFGRDGQPEDLDAALRHAQATLSPGLA